VKNLIRKLSFLSHNWSVFKLLPGIDEKKTGGPWGPEFSPGEILFECLEKRWFC
jgi:hypothetical protein